MLGLRPTIILSLVLALLVNLVTAGGGKNASCDQCTQSFVDCIKVRLAHIYYPRSFTNVTFRPPKHLAKKPIANAAAPSRRCLSAKTRAVSVLLRIIAVLEGSERNAPAMEQAPAD